MKNKDFNLNDFLEIKKNYEKALKPIYKEAYRLLKIINRIDPINGFKSLTIEDIDINDDGSGTIYFFGENYWQYGGYEKYEFSMPSKILFYEDDKKKYFSKIIDKKLNKLRKIREQKAGREKKEKEKYEALKLKFENQGEENVID